MLLGLNLMHNHQIWLNWSDIKKGFLTLKNKVLVETLDICEKGPQPMTCSNLTLPTRTFEVIDIHVDLKVNSPKHTYEVMTNSLLMDRYPNMVGMPVIHIMPRWTDTFILLL